MDPIQFVIIVVSLSLTLLIVVLGVQVFYILKEMRISAQKVNKMLDDAGKVSGSVSSTVEGMSGLVSGIKTGLSLFSGLRGKGEEDE